MSRSGIAFKLGTHLASGRQGVRVAISFYPYCISHDSRVIAVVESIGKSGIPTVVRDGWDMGYEWDECKFLVRRLQFSIIK